MAQQISYEDASDAEVPASVAFMQGLPALQGAFTGFDLTGLVRGAWRRGVLGAVTELATAADVAARTNLPVDHVRRVLTALLAHEVVDRHGECYVVSDRWRPLLLDPAPISLTTLLRFAEARSRMLEDAVSTGRDYWAADLSDQVVYATGVSVDPESVHGRELLALGLALDEELVALLERGGDYLELGCGAAGALCALLQLYPRVRGTGVELSAALVHVARARAQRLGIGDRLEVVLGDAAEFDRPGAYDFAFWSQFFFPTPSRAAALHALHRSLRPGGVLTAPLLAEPVTETADLRTDDGRDYAVDALLHGSWGVPETSAAALQHELVDAGFIEPRYLELPHARVVRAVRP